MVRRGIPLTALLMFLSCIRFSNGLARIASPSHCITGLLARSLSYAASASARTIAQCTLHVERTNRSHKHGR